MKRILVLGAGRSSTSLIEYLLENRRTGQWSVTVGDFSLDNALSKIGSADDATAVRFDMNDAESSKEIIAAADIVISLLPPDLHALVARRCLEAHKHFVTASYVTDELKALDKEAARKGLVFLNECGLDPGIDHMSAMKVIDRIRAAGGMLTTFESFTGGLISPETDPGNPWRYKFTWNPRNVVMAGQGTAKFLYDGACRYIPYHQLFRRTTPVYVPDYGHYEGYANRNSLKYIDTYGLDGISTMLRGTLRNKGFCSGWNILVQLGCCDDTYLMEDAARLTHAGFLDRFLPPLPQCKGVEEKICTWFGLKPSDAEIKMLKWSGFFEQDPVGLPVGTPAQILEHILNKRWSLNEQDKDQIVLWHRFGYRLDGMDKEIQAWLVATGSDHVNTAMAKTVGLPLAMATRLILQGEIRATGVVIPTTPEFYDPILAALATRDITLDERQIR